jgi:transposase
MVALATTDHQIGAVAARNPTKVTRTSSTAARPRSAAKCGAANAKLVQAWLARPGCRIKLHFIPTYCPHLDPIERLWGLMHKHVTHNRCHATFADFKAAILTFLREEVPRKWHTYCDQVTDNFRIISPISTPRSRRRTRSPSSRRIVRSRRAATGAIKPPDTTWSWSRCRTAIRSRTRTSGRARTDHAPGPKQGS